MEIWDSPTVAAASAAQQVLRDYVLIHGKDISGDPMNFGFWTGTGDVSVTVVGAVTREDATNNYIGGAMQTVGDLSAAIGLGASPATIRLSQIHLSVQDMVRGYDIRHAVVEVHRGRLDASTYSLVSKPLPIFLGKVRTIDVDRPKAGSTGNITLNCVSESIGLTRPNPIKKSAAQQERRSGDKFREYGDSATPVGVWWGEERAT